MIQAVGFDLYGTLLEKESHWKGPFTLLFERFQKDSAFKAKHTARSYAVELMIGNFKSVKAVSEYFKVALSPDEIADFERLIREDVKRVRLASDSEHLMQVVEKTGAKIFCISNLAYPYAVPVMTKGIQPRLDGGTFFSFRTGMVKPDPRMYRDAAWTLKVDPAEILFVGDSPKNDVLGPQKVGMRTASILDFRQRPNEFLRERA